MGLFVDFVLEDDDALGSSSDWYSGSYGERRTHQTNITREDEQWGACC